jgi:NAD(P)H-dependent FMN reductase
MKFTIVSGSTRVNPQSRKVAKYVEHSIKANLVDVDTYLLDLSVANLKYWDETFWSDYENFDPAWNIARKELNTSDAVVIVCPEWNGMIPPAVKNFFHLCTKGELANKPGLIVTVSSSVNGVYPVIELRANTYKNTFITYIPQHVIVRNVGQVLNNFESIESDEDKIIRERLDYTLRILNEYAKALVMVRKSEVIQKNPYPYGM